MDTHMDTILPTSPSTDLVDAIRRSLEARLERLLQRPLVASVGTAPSDDYIPINVDDDDEFDIFGAMKAEIIALRPSQGLAGGRSAWRDVRGDGSCLLSISIDYDDLWRGYERDVMDTVQNTVEGSVLFLTDTQRALLLRSPREFLALNPGPEQVELLSFEREWVGGVERVVRLELAATPKDPQNIHTIAIVPNLVPIERQLDGLRVIEQAEEPGALVPLRMLLGLSSATQPHKPESTPTLIRQDVPTSLDEFQLSCVSKALSTPHFAIIQGPPGSGKTTVISTIIDRALARGERVLVVSPTHVAVDNVVEKLVPQPDDDSPDPLEVRSLPVRVANTRVRLLDSAAAYRVGPKTQLRGATLSKRVERRLRAMSPIARQLFARLDPEADGYAPLSGAVASVQRVICGTPIGILSYDQVKNAGPGAFDLLVVDEVSKMTLPEFLAVAIKAKRWVLVGDPRQLPPYNDAEENGTSLDDLVSPLLDLCCCVGAVLERARPASRSSLRLVVVSSAPAQAAKAIQAHLHEVGLYDAPRVRAYSDPAQAGIMVCGPDDVEPAVRLVSRLAQSDRGHSPDQRDGLQVLVERGVVVARPTVDCGLRLLEPRLRAAAAIFSGAFDVYHAQPWATRSGQKLAVVSFRNGFHKLLPSAAAMASLGQVTPGLSPHAARAALIDALALRYAIGTVSVYDWLTGIPQECFDVEPLTNLADVLRPLASLQAAVAPYVGTLRKQYRMHSSLSQVPRELFYFGEALENGLPDSAPGTRVRLLQVAPEGPRGETNDAEASAICDMLLTLDRSIGRKRKTTQRVLVITPYRKQERALREAIEEIEEIEGLCNVVADVCTLDRCQGREAEFVMISLVRSRATTFLDAPKRWNVALTRAKDGMFIFGDVDAYLREAAGARRFVRQRSGVNRPRMSLLARIVESYDQQIAATERRHQTGA